jgi:hypothetical protein
MYVSRASEAGLCTAMNGAVIISFRVYVPRIDTSFHKHNIYIYIYISSIDLV